MKLKTKLIPFASLAVATTAAIPLLLTSCGKNNGFINLLERYIPTIEQLPMDSVTEAMATKEYIDGAKNNPEIIKQDFCWYASNSVIQVGKENAKYHFIKVFDTACSSYKTQDDKLHPVISFSIDYKMNYSYAVDTSTTNELTYTGTSIYKNIPFDVKYDTPNSLWKLQCNLDLLFDKNYCKSNNWQISLQYYQLNEYSVVDSQYGDYTYSEEFNDNDSYNAQEVINETLDYKAREEITLALEEDGYYYSWYLFNLLPY